VNATLRLNTKQTEVSMDYQEEEQEQVSFGRARSAIGRIRTTASAAVASVPKAARSMLHRAGRVGGSLPGTLGHVRSGAEGTVTNLQSVPDSGLRLMAAVSVGFGAGLRLAGKKRLAAVVGFVPASVFGFAIFSRPRPARPEPDPIRP
jgi:hypothetical protein